jgi:hypothetical protein
MKSKNDDPQAPKISREFEARLIRLDSERKVRAIVMLQINRPDSEPGQQQARKSRQATIKSIRQTADLALHDVDTILERFDGKRLTDNANALASILVEAPPDGIRALADSKHVKAIFEDQAIASLLHHK